MRLNLKIAFLRTGKTQRAIGLEAHIPETRVSDIVRGRVEPTPAEREQLRRVLGSDPFLEPDGVTR